MPWILITVALGLIAGLTLSALAIRSRRQGADDGDDVWLTVGIALLAAGAATIPTIGFVMVGVAATGLALLVMVALRRADR